jgi:hypothetical protein
MELMEETTEVASSDQGRCYSTPGHKPARLGVVHAPAVAAAANVGAMAAVSQVARRVAGARIAGITAVVAPPMRYRSIRRNRSAAAHVRQHHDQSQNDRRHHLLHSRLSFRLKLCSLANPFPKRYSRATAVRGHFFSVCRTLFCLAARNLARKRVEIAFISLVCAV